MPLKSGKGLNPLVGNKAFYCLMKAWVISNLKWGMALLHSPLNYACEKFIVLLIFEQVMELVQLRGAISLRKEAVYAYVDSVCFVHYSCVLFIILDEVANILIVFSFIVSLNFAVEKKTHATDGKSFMSLFSRSENNQQKPDNCGNVDIFFGVSTKLYSEKVREKLDLWTGSLLKM